MKNIIVVIMCLVAGTGCSTTFRHLPATQARVIESAREEASAADLAVGQVRRDVSAALVTSPSNAPLIRADWSSQMASKLAARTVALLGPPALPQTIRVESMLSTNASERAQSQAREQARELTQSADVSSQRAMEAVLIEKGKLFEIEHNKGVVRRVWGWLIGSVGFWGLVALCFLCPAVLPLLGSALGWLISKVPQISSFVGLVGKRSYERAVTAIQEIKVAAKRSGQPIAESIAREVAAENTAKDAALVAHVKDKLDYA